MSLNPSVPKKAQQQLWWLIPALLAAALGLASRAIYVEEREAQLKNLDIQAKLAARIILERVSAAEAETLALANSLGQRLAVGQGKPSQTDRDRIDAFYDHAEYWLPRSRASELFWFPKQGAPQAISNASFELRARAGAQGSQLREDLDIGQTAWTKPVLSRALASTTAIAVSVPRTGSSTEPQNLLILAAVLTPGEVDRSVSVVSRLQGYLGVRINMSLIIPAVDQENRIKVFEAASTSQRSAVGGATTQERPSPQLQWSPEPGTAITQGLDWRVAIGKQPSALIDSVHLGSLVTLSGGLIFALLLLVYLRSRQRLTDLQQIAVSRAESRLHTESSMSELATTARGLGVFRLDPEGSLIAADAKALEILGRDSKALNSLSLRQWWLGVGERAPRDALESLRSQTQQRGFVSTMAALPDHTLKEVGLSVNRIQTGQEVFWVGVIEDLSKRPWNDLELSAVMSAFESARSELSIWTNDLQCLKFNRAFAAAHPDAATAPMRANLSDLAGPAAVQHARLALQGAPQTLQLQRTNPRSQHRELIEHRFEALPQQSPHGQALLLITSENITSTVESRLALIQTVHAYEALVARSTLAICKFDRTGQLTYLNPAAARLLDQSHAAVPTSNIADLLPAVDEGDTRTVWQRMQAGDALDGFEAQFRLADGSLKAARLFASAEAGEAGDSSYWLIAQDRTAELSQARQHKDMASIALTVLQSQPNAMAIFNANDEIVFFNQAFAVLYRASAQAMHRGVRYEAFLRFGLGAGQYPAVRQKHEDWIQERLAAHAQALSRQVLALDNQNWIEQIEFKLSNNFSAVFANDVTVEQNALEQSKKSSEAKSAFLAAMSHEIRTPLNGILGMAQILTAPALSEDKRLDYAQTILDSGNVLLHLLNQALDLSKIEAGKVEMQLTPTDPARLCHSAAELFASNAELKSLTLTDEWSGPEALYELDQTRLSQMLFNLVGNAIKFTEQGGVRIEAKELRRSGMVAELEFSVTDTGPGVTETQRQMLFQPFSQLENAANSNTGSAGLGLSIVRAMAELMGGRADVESVAGAGARFFFTVTATLSDTAGPDAPAQTPDKIERPMATGLRVLLMEDNAVMRQLLERMISSLGAEVVAFNNGQSGMDAIAAGDPAKVILLDLEMPGLGGLVVAELIRAQELQSQERPRLLAAVTASSTPKDREDCIKAGIDALLLKPVSLTDLSDFLSRAIASTEPEVGLSPPLTDRQRIQLTRLWRELKPQLEAQQYYAMNTFAHLFDLLEGHGFNAALIEAQNHLNSYDFEKVLHTVEGIMEAITKNMR